MLSAQFGRLRTLRAGINEAMERVKQLQQDKAELGVGVIAHTPIITDDFIKHLKSPDCRIATLVLTPPGYQQKGHAPLI